MKKTLIETNRLMRPIAHFSHAVKIGNLIHIGATAGTDAARRLAGTTSGLADVQAQTAQMFDNIATVLELCGSRVEDVVRIKTYLVDLRDLPTYQRCYSEWAGASAFSHTVVGSAGFPLPQALVEADLVAIIDGGGRKPATDANGCSSAMIDDRHYCSVSMPFGKGVVSGGEAQCADALVRLGAALAAAGLAMRDVVNIHVTLADIRDLAVFEKSYRATFSMPFPSGTIVIAPLAHAQACIQVETVSCKGGGKPVAGGAASAPDGLFSPGTLLDGELFLSGQSSVGSESAPDCVEAQTRRAWTKLGAVLANCGMNAAHMLRTNNVLTDWRDYAEFNAGYGANVAPPYPPRATVLGTLAMPGARVQIEGIAHRDGDQAVVLTVPGMS